MIFAIGFLLCPPVGSAKAQSSIAMDKEIAAKAAAIATNRLADNIEDERAFMLLQMASKIDPKNKTVIKTLGVISKEMTPDKIKVRVSEEKLYKVMRKRGDELYSSKRHLNLAALYFRIMEFAAPEDTTAFVGLRRLLRRDKINYKLAELLGEVELFDDIEPDKKPKEKPKEEPKPKYEGPIVNGSSGGWSVAIWDGQRWSPKPLNAMQNATQGGGITAKNTTKIGQKAILIYNHVYSGPVNINIRMKGAKELILMPNDGRDIQFKAKSMGERGFHWYSIRGPRNDLTFFVDGKKQNCRRPKGLDQTPLVFGVVLWRNQVVQIGGTP